MIDRYAAQGIVQAAASGVYQPGGSALAAMPYIVVALVVEVATLRAEVLELQTAQANLARWRDSFVTQLAAFENPTRDEEA